MLKTFFTIVLLMPLSFLWSFVYRLRRFLYSYGYLSSHSFCVPIISIGNLTFGGTGKTPFSLWLADYCFSQNKKTMILTRGYRGALEKSHGILRSDRRLGFDPFKFGDEATMLVRKLRNAAIVVGRNRSENLDYYFSKEKPDVVLLDDGHQHLKLKRDLNIVLFDCLLPMSRYQVAPAGYLREGLSALKDADIIILGRYDQATKYQVESLEDLLRENIRRSVPFVKMKYCPLVFQNSAYEKVFSLDEIKERKVICLAGIASPHSFFDLVEGLGANIVDCISFPDHHSFSKDDFEEIMSLAEKEDAYIVTTEKDIVKIRSIIDSPRIIHLEISVEFPEGKTELTTLLNQAISQ